MIVQEMRNMNGESVKTQCIIKLCEMYPVYRKLICGLFDKNEFRFTKTQQLVIMTLWFYGKMSLSELSVHICTSNEQATRAVGQLVKMNMVSRVKNEQNRREIELSLTQQAIAAVEQAQEKIVARFPKSFEGVSDEDAKVILDSLEKIGGIIKKNRK